MVESGLDVSPEATAERIVSLSTAFFPAFREANPDESEQEALVHFMDVIRGGIADNIDLTYDLVQEKLDAFQQNRGQLALEQ